MAEKVECHQLNNQEKRQEASGRQARKSGKSRAPSMLLSLPGEVLQEIVRRAGPPSSTTEPTYMLDAKEHLELRLVCKALREAVDKAVTVVCYLVENCGRPGMTLADTGDYLRQYLPRWPSVTGLYLEFCLASDYLDYVLTTAARARPGLHLVHLKMDKVQVELETEPTSCLASLSSFTSLQELHIEGAQVYPQCLNGLSLPSLQRLLLTDVGPGLSLAPLPALQTLKIGVDIFNRRFEGLSASLPHLHASSALTSLSLRELQLPGLPLPQSLQALELLDVAVSEPWDEPSARLPSLTRLVLDRVRVGGVESILLNTSLTFLRFSLVLGVSNLSALASLSKLTSLNMHVHVLVPELPDLASLHALTHIDVGGFKLVEAMPAVSSLPQLSHLRVVSMALLQGFPDLGLQLGSLTHLDVTDCKLLHTIPSISSATNLNTLVLENLPLLQSLPELSSLVSLQWLKLSGLTLVEEVPIVTSLRSLDFLRVAKMDLLKKLPDMRQLSSLTQLQVAECPLLDILGRELPKSIKHLSLSRLEKLDRVPSLTDFDVLKELRITDCDALQWATVPPLARLKTLSVAGCTSLRRLAFDNESPYLKDINIAGCSKLPGINLTPQYESDDGDEGY